MQQELKFYTLGNFSVEKLTSSNIINGKLTARGGIFWQIEGALHLTAEEIIMCSWPINGMY